MSKIIDEIFDARRKFMEVNLAEPKSLALGKQEMLDLAKWVASWEIMTADDGALKRRILTEPKTWWQGMFLFGLSLNQLPDDAEGILIQ